jgi:hypothetical protein
MVRESQVVNGWIQAGKQEGILHTKRENLLRLVRIRLADPVPEKIRLAVEGTNDLNTLGRWFELAATAASLEQFRNGMRQTP